jgi:hypothetical protein
MISPINGKAVIKSKARGTVFFIFNQRSPPGTVRRDWEYRIADSTDRTAGLNYNLILIFCVQIHLNPPKPIHVANNYCVVSDIFNPLMAVYQYSRSTYYGCWIWKEWSVHRFFGRQYGTRAKKGGPPHVWSAHYRRNHTWASLISIHPCIWRLVLVSLYGYNFKIVIFFNYYSKFKFTRIITFKKIIMK